MTEKYAYTAYGINTVTGSGSAAYRFAGRRFDAETGLYHNRARAYSPTLGRFLQTDPIGTKDNINLYAYAANSPVSGTDPMGNSTLWSNVGIAIPAAGASGGGAIVGWGVIASGAIVGALLERFSPHQPRHLEMTSFIILPRDQP
ncbi:RHS repeat-associated core domain-containing protein [Mesorhizobium sp. M1403]|uniref:RHS repeat-associated core domain-containing protein n=1 Tax=Mesorhizobium sp. M1403 TaxID=2957097 RepID=UPI00333C24AF